MFRFIIMSGLPASGKTTLGRRIASRLGLPFIDKDDFLEALFESQGIGDSKQRQPLSRAADLLFRSAVLNEKKVVITSWWKHPRSESNSGTSVDWLLPFSSQCYEVHCQCPPQVAVERFVSRKRHPGHGDSYRNPSALIYQFKTQSKLGPLTIGRVFQISASNRISSSKLDEICSNLITDDV